MDIANPSEEHLMLREMVPFKKPTEISGQFLGRGLVGLLGPSHLDTLLFFPGEFDF